MAYIAQPQGYNQDEEQNPSLPQPVGQFGGGGAPAASVSSESRPSNFPDLQRYLAANANQAESLAGTIAQPVEEGTAQATSRIGTAPGEYQQTVEAANPIVSSDTIAKAKTDATSLTDPEREAFINTRVGQYTSPDYTQTEPYKNLLSDVSDVTRRGTALGSTEGRASLFGDLSEDPTRGKNLLNEMLVSGNAMARDRLAAAAGGTTGLQDALSGAVAEAQGYGDAQRAALQAASQDLIDQFLGESGYMSQWGQNLQDAYNQATTGANQKLSSRYAVPQDMITALSSPWDYYNSSPNRDYIMRPTELLDWQQQEVDEANRIYRERLADAIHSPTFRPDLAQYATADQYAQEAALEDLLGQSFDYLQNDRSGEAGTFWKEYNTAMGGAPDWERYRRQFVYNPRGYQHGTRSDEPQGTTFRPGGSGGNTIMNFGYADLPEGL